MKKTGYIELFANIKTTLISFISITMFVFLGIGVFLGLSWTGFSMKSSLDGAYKKGNAHDLQISYLYGISDSEAKEFLKYENIDNYELEYKAYETFEKNGNLYQAAIISYTNNIDTLTLLEGELPKNNNEILIEKGSSENAGVNIGDVVTFKDGNGTSNKLINIIKNYSSDKFDEIVEELDDEYKNLKYDSYKVVGIVEHPNYLSKSQASYGVNNDGLQIQTLFFLDYDCFNEDITNNNYNSIILKSDSLINVKNYDDKYIEQNKENKNSIQSKAEELSNISYARVKNNLDQFLKDAKDKIDDGQKDIDQAELDLLEAQNEIITNEKKLIDAKKELADGKTKLDDAANEIAKAEAEINDAEDQINSKQAELDEAKEEIDNAKLYYAYFFANLDYNILDMRNRLNDPYELENVKEVIKTIRDLQDGYDISEIEETFNDNGIEFSDELQEDVDELEKDFNKFKFDFLMNIFKEFIDLESNDPSITDLEDVVERVDDIITSVDSKEITIDEALEELDSEYKDNKTLFEYILYNSWGNFAQATLNTLDDFDQRIDDLSLEAQGVIGRCLAEGEAYITYANKLLADARIELNAGIREFNAGKKEYEENLALYEENLVKYNDGINKLNKAKKDVEKANLDIEQAKLDIAKAREDYDELVDKSKDIKDYGVTILTRSDNTATPYMNLISDIIIKLKYSLGGLFLIISIMVCYSVVTRNINNQIKELGTKKALGLYNREITISCLAYTLMSVIIGSIFGVLLAFGIEIFLVPSVQGSFNFKLTAGYFSFKEFLLIFVVELVLMTSVTYLGCKNILKQDAVKLLQGKQPPENKNRFFEKTGFWKSLSLLNKTIINNCINDPMRAIATIIGVAGCTALIVSSITLKDNVSKSFAKQYAEYFNFDSFVYFDKNNEEVRDKLENYFDEHDIAYADVYRSLTYIEVKGEPKIFGYEMVYEDSEAFENLVAFEPVNGEFNYQGLWIPESYEKYYGLSSNEPTIITDAYGESYNTYIDGYYKYYSYMLQVYIDAETYSELTGEEYKPNIYLVDLNGNNYNDVLTDLNKIDGFTSMMDYYNYCKSDVDIFTNVSTMMVGLYLVISTLMSIFVLLNLYATFIDEKKRELIVLMINGYSIKQANKYIYSDTIFLTAIGLVLGVIVGIITGDLSVASFENNSMYMIHEIDVYACIGGVIITSILSFVMCKIALKKIANFELTDINKV